MGKRKYEARKALIATRDEKLKAQSDKNVNTNKDKFNELVDLIENRNNKSNNGLLLTEAELADGGDKNA